MVEGIGSDKAAGISRLSGCLARYYQPLFLHRNLQQALSYHEDQLSNANWDEQRLMATAARAEKRWQPPDRKRIDLLASRQQPEFNIQVRRIRTQAREALPDSMIGLKRPRLPRLDCEIEVTIWEVRPGQESVSLVRDATECRLQARQTSSSSLPEFHVTMEPLSISTNRMKCDIGEDGNWQRGLASNYHLDICILFKSSTDARTYFDLAHPRRFPDDFVIPKRTRLATRWRRFPKLPKLGEALSLAITDGDDRQLTPYVLDVDMSFSVSRHSILAEHNYLMKLKDESNFIVVDGRGSGTIQSNGSLQNGSVKRTPPATRAIAEGVRLGFIWADQEAFIAVKGFCCAICNAGRRFPSRETLLQHLRSSHEYFQSELVDASRGRFAKLNLHYVIELSLAPGFTDKGPDLPPSRAEREAARAIAWLVPKRPFNLHKHLSGDDWAGLAPQPKKHRSSPVKVHSARIALQASSSKAPEDVQDLPKRPRKKVRFTKTVGGQPVFKLDSKRRLQQDDVISESDEDIDTEWMKPRREALTKKAEVSDECEEFSARWNDYLERNENLSADAFVGDAIIRFLRQHGDEFMNKTQNELMGALLRSCHASGVLQDSFLTFGLDLLRQKLAESQQFEQQVDSATHASTTTPLRRGRGGRAGSESTRAVVNRDSSSSRTPTSIRKHGSALSMNHMVSVIADGDPMDIDPPPGEHEASHGMRSAGNTRESVRRTAPGLPDGVHCVCGKEVDSMHRIVICANFKNGCRQPKYHMSCLNLKQRQPVWLCPLCTSKA